MTKIGVKGKGYEMRYEGHKKIIIFAISPPYDTCIGSLRSDGRSL